jgi:enoyl-CoA hydratase/carnithine racemase
MAAVFFGIRTNGDSQTMSDKTYITMERRDRVGYVTLNRPDKLNAMPRKMYQEISAGLQEYDADDDIWVIVVRGAGDRAFSAGADLELLHGSLTTGPFEWKPFKADRFDMGLQVSKPVIAAVHGFCLAGGMELAMSCDIRIAADNAMFAAPEVKWSVLHGFGALVMPRSAPLGAVMELLMTGRRFDAQEAYRLGIVNRVVPVADLQKTVDDLADEICRNGPLAVRMTKEIVLRGRELPLNDGLRIYRELNKLIHLTEDSTEGAKAWAERRPARYAAR